MIYLSLDVEGECSEMKKVGNRGVGFDVFR